jgi:hypothetical protein
LHLRHFEILEATPWLFFLGFILFASEVRVGEADLFLHHEPVEVGFELTQEDLDLAIYFELGDDQEILANESLALDNDVVVAVRKISAAAQDVIHLLFFLLFLCRRVAVVGTIQQVDHREGHQLELLEVGVEAVVEHELNNLKDFRRHHVLANFDNVLNPVRLVQVLLYESFDHSQRSWHLDLGLLDGVVQVVEVDELIWHELRQLSPNTRGGRDLQWLERISVHVHVKENSEKESAQLVR